MRAAFILLPLLIASGCVSQQASPPASYKDFTFEAEDRFVLYADLYQKEGARPIILLHQLGRDRSSWRGFAAELNKMYAVLAVDMRGHGQSTIQNGVQKQHTSFSETDFNNMVRDVEAAKEFLKIMGYDTSKIAVIGASIGANVALASAALDKDIAEVVLLSPGLDYRGVNAEQAAYRYKGPALIMASEGDTYSADSSKTLAGIMEGSALKLYSGSAHGTDLLANNEARKAIHEWLEDNFG